MIIFTEAINEDTLRYAYNNQVFRFYSDSGQPAKYADVSNGAFTVRLYPSPNNSFYFNLKPYISAYANTQNFEDNVIPDLDITEASSFVYDGSPGFFTEDVYTFTVTLDNDTTDTVTKELTFITGAQQISRYSALSRAELQILTPSKGLQLNTYYVKYWEGYPFDVPVYTPEDNIFIYNNTNLLAAAFSTNNYPICRLFFSDGRTDETIEEFLPLIMGQNQLHINHFELGGVTDKFLTVDKAPHRCGVYFKFLNQSGGFSYWLFEDTAAIDRSTKSLGDLYSDFENIERSRGRSLNIGQATQDSLRVVTELLTPEQAAIVTQILDSPKIYLFTGKAFSRNGKYDWQEVTLKTTSARVKEYKNNKSVFALDFDLPQRDTVTL